MRSRHSCGNERPDAPTAVLIFAVNPFGMAHFRRANDNNVDLSPEHFEQLLKGDKCRDLQKKFDPVFN